MTEQEIGLEMLGGREGRRVSEPPRPPPAGASGGGGGTGPLAARLWLGQRAGGVVVPVVTALLAFLIGGSVVAATGHNPLIAYRDIFNGAGLNWFFHPTTDTATDTAAYNLSQTMLQTTTLILTGLAVAFAFRCGMFNIGGQGQYFVGLYVANWIGYSFAGMSTLPHILIGILAQRLPVRLGRNRRLPEGDRRRPRGDLDDHAQLDRDLGRTYLVGRGGPLQNSANATVPISNDVVQSAKLPVFWGDKDLQGLHVALFVSIAALVVFWAAPEPHDAGIRSACGRIQPRAAPYGGISVRKNLIRAMAISGAFAGLAGGIDMLGYLYRSASPTSRSRSVGFLGIAVALLGRNTAVGVGLERAAVRRAALRHDPRPPSNIDPGLAGNLTYIIQGLIVLFVGADLLILSVWNARRKRGRGEGRKVEATA